jgi:hypothetical protein
MKEELFELLLRLADDQLVLGQRVSANGAAMRRRWKRIWRCRMSRST